MSCDYNNFENIEKILKFIGHLIIGIKLHADIITDFNETTIQKINNIKQQYNTEYFSYIQAEKSLKDPVFSGSAL